MREAYAGALQLARMEAELRDARLANSQAGINGFRRNAGLAHPARERACSQNSRWQNASRGLRHEIAF